MNPYASAKQAYTESSVLTAPAEQLVVMLYDGAIRFLTQSSSALRAGNRDVFLARLRRGEAIIAELNATLDMGRGGDVAAQLRSIYLFCKRHLVEAQLKSYPDRIDQVVALLRDLRDSWAALADGPNLATAAG